MALNNTNADDENESEQLWSTDTDADIDVGTDDTPRVEHGGIVKREVDVADHEYVELVVRDTEKKHPETWESLPRSWYVNGLGGHFKLVYVPEEWEEGDR